MSRLPAALAYGLIRRGCSPANARHAMAARWAWPAAEGGRLAQQTRLAGQAILTTGYRTFAAERSDHRGRADDATVGGPEGGTYTLAAAGTGATTATATSGALAATATAGEDALRGSTATCWDPHGWADRDDRAGRDDRADGHTTALRRSHRVLAAVSHQ